ncbi:MAG: sigma-70 family RNA polymerase sigma factor [Prevotella sp.]|nr:sigma-70 family RNA polymerase sigma factor [Prevotella sp.]MBP5507686.1 sigma-70 family RNA polymerase sigma factor [Prevotella sp.]
MRKKAMEAYKEEIAEKTLLTDEEERKLAQRIQEGDEKAVNILVESNLRFVLTIANGYRDQGIAYDDLVGEGNVGLLKAAKRFSPYPGKRFVKFAAPIIRDAIQRHIEQHSGLYKVPRTEASGAEMRRSHPISVDAPIPAGSNNNFNLLNLLENANSPYADRAFEDADSQAHIERVIQVLNDRQQRVITLLYGIGCDRVTMAEAAALMGLKRERVRQIRDAALRKLKA